MVDQSALEAFIRRNARVKARAEQALRENPNDVTILCMVSALYDTMGDFVAAQAVADRAVAIDSNNPDTHFQRGVVLRHRGDFSSALEAQWRAVALEPLAARAYHEIAHMGGLAKRPDALPTLISLFERVSGEPGRALLVGHAIAKVLEDSGDYEASFDWLVRAKQGVGALIRYNHAEAADFHAAASETLGAAVEQGYDSAEPIFVVGLPRTGTTLVERILGAHPDVLSAGEMSNLAVLINCIAGQPGDAEISRSSLNIAAAFDAITFGKAYVESTRPLTGSHARFTDKAPSNYPFAGLIHHALPRARIICLRRNPADACISMFKQPLNPTQYSFTSDIAECARSFVLFDDFITRCEEALPRDRFALIEYESLVRNFEPEVRRLVDFCGLSWDERCLCFYESDAPVTTPSGQQVRSPIYKGAIGRWRKYGEKLRPALEVFADAGVDIIA